MNWSIFGLESYMNKRKLEMLVAHRLEVALFGLDAFKCIEVCPCSAL